MSRLDDLLELRARVDREIASLQAAAHVLNPTALSTADQEERIARHAGIAVVRRWARVHGVDITGGVTLDIRLRYARHRLGVDVLRPVHEPVAEHPIPEDDTVPEDVMKLATTVQTSTVRKWAQANDINVPIRGRVRTEVRIRYARAQLATETTLTDEIAAAQETQGATS